MAIVSEKVNRLDPRIGDRGVGIRFGSTLQPSLSPPESAHFTLHWGLTLRLKYLVPADGKIFLWCGLQYLPELHNNVKIGWFARVTKRRTIIGLDHLICRADEWGRISYPHSEKVDPDCGRLWRGHFYLQSV